jgi:peptidoglycan/LPS O-acetylase OafA/YrhL
VFVHHSLGIPLLWIGVDLFFVLSGYLITGILIRTRSSGTYFRTFYARRALRIMPPYYAVLAIAFAGLYAGYASSIPWFLAYLSNFNSVWRLTPAPDALNLMWTLAIEEQFYLLWPLVVSFVAPRKLPALCAGLFFAAALARAFCALAFSNHRAAYYLLPCRMDLLAAGALIACLESTRSDWLRRHAHSAAWVSAGSVALFAALGFGFPTFRTGANSLAFNTIGYALICLGVASCLVAVQFGKFGPVQRVLCWTPMRYLGTISYACYLVHAIVLSELRGFPNHSLAGASLAFLLTVGIASASWFLLELPLQRIKQERFRYG